MNNISYLLGIFNVMNGSFSNRSADSSDWQDFEIKPYEAPKKTFASKEEKAQAFAEAAKLVGNVNVIDSLVEFILNEDQASDQPYQENEET